MKFAIGTTRAGLTLKKDIIAALEKHGHEVDDLGMKDESEFIAYHVAAANVARSVSEGKYEKGIIICGTGAGSTIVANKFKGVYAVHCSNGFEAKRAVAVNNANVLVLAEWLTPGQHGIEILETWLNTKFGEGFDPKWQEFLKNCYLEIQQMEKEQFK
ncbi:sugar-phosphate isomerase, RpiB/LacA/LacB family [Candidatus Vecturithrix granuli]|uniref:Sugar-phosphate isomerase, RpiB/LacA/LacB family n=1 Tax=Vecturithrix granuli TaxID=1499967 RepID=A0A0S6W7A7_VECG1|nr:sugar-phosphate isomerase, RpiB/LacA/LacB family [Candidatus Vecturithrix granuli]